MYRVCSLSLSLSSFATLVSLQNLILSFHLLHDWPQFLREFLEALDLFVGRYLVLLATFYIGIKFLHYKVFPDFP